MNFTSNKSNERVKFNWQRRLLFVTHLLLSECSNKDNESRIKRKAWTLDKETEIWVDGKKEKERDMEHQHGKLQKHIQCVIIQVCIFQGPYFYLYMKIWSQASCFVVCPEDFKMLVSSVSSVSLSYLLSPCWTLSAVVDLLWELCCMKWHRVTLIEVTCG